MQNTITTTSIIAYNIYLDVAHSAPIQADTSVGTSSVSIGTAVNIPLYGRAVSTGQSTPTPTAGTYADTLPVIIAW